MFVAFVWPLAQVDVCRDDDVEQRRFRCGFWRGFGGGFWRRFWRRFRRRFRRGFRRRLRLLNDRICVIRIFLANPAIIRAIADLEPAVF